MRLRNEQRQQQTQKLTFQQEQLLEEAKKSIGYIEYCVAERTRYEYKNGKIEKIIDAINKPDKKTPDVYEYITRH